MSTSIHLLRTSSTYNDTDTLPPQHPRQCQLLGPTALIVQALILASLILKRQLEKRKRPWKIWIWDVSKQLAGQGVIHGLNLLISGVVARVAHNNPCSLYFLNVLIDTTLGVGIFYLALKGFTWLFTHHLGMEGFRSGHYGTPPRPLYWWRQLIPYLISIILMKILVILPLTLPIISPFLLRLAHSAIEHLSPSIQVKFVMAIFPLIMNVIQFCLVDQFIKGGLQRDEAIPDGDTRVTGVDEESIPERGEGVLVKGSPETLGPRSPLLTPGEGGRSYGSGTSSGRVSPMWSGLLDGSRTGERERRDMRRSNAPSPEAEIPNPTAFSTVSRVSKESQREARDSLSPTRADMERFDDDGYTIDLEARR